LEGLIQQGEVPTAGHLAEQRRFRDGLWRKICQQTFPEVGQPEPQEALPTPSEYEGAVQAADGTADSRFADAARVSQHAELVKRIAQMRNVIELDRQRLAEETQAKEDLQLKWQALLDKHGLPSLNVAELTDWLGKRELFVQRYLAWVDVKDQQQAAAQRTAKARAGLSASLAEAGLAACGEQ